MTLFEMLGSLGLIASAVLGFCWGLGYGFLCAICGAMIAGLIGWVVGVLIAHALV